MILKSLDDLGEFFSPSPKTAIHFAIERKEPRNPRTYREQSSAGVSGVYGSAYAGNRREFNARCSTERVRWKV